VEVRSRHGQQRPEKLGRRQSTTVYYGRPVMTMKLSEDDLDFNISDTVVENITLFERDNALC